MPQVSVGMPVFNGQNYVSAAIDSILAQTFTDFELIVSDNASTDATWEIVQDYARRDSRVRAYRNDRNMGAAYNFNRTFELARGKFFKQAAHDDTIAPQFLERCVEALNADHGIALVYTQSLCIDELDNVITHYRDVMPLGDPRPSVRFGEHLRRAFDRSPERNLGSNPVCNPVFGLGRTRILRRTPAIVGNYVASDQILLGELALYGTLVEIPEELLTIRAHPGTSWANNAGVLEVAAWFDPGNRYLVASYMPHWRWLHEYRMAIDRVPLEAAERRRCHALLKAWAFERRRELAAETVSVAVRLAGLRAWQGAGRRLGPPRVYAG